MITVTVPSLLLTKPIYFVEIASALLLVFPRLSERIYKRAKASTLWNLIYSILSQGIV